MIGRLKMEVRSRRKPVRSFSITHPHYSPTGVFLGTTTSIGVVYQDSLDEQSRKALEQAGKLSSEFGLTLEVVDESHGLLGRVLRRAEHRMTTHPPSVLPSLNCEQSASDYPQTTG